MHVLKLIINELYILYLFDMQIKLIQSTSKCRELRKKDFSKTKTKVKKIEITLSKFSNNLINYNCKKSSNLLIIKNRTFF